MSNSEEKPNHFTAIQQRLWFRFWIFGLAAFFVLVSGMAAMIVWRARAAENQRHAQIMDPAAPDPGVTAAAESKTDSAIPVKVGIYMERVPEFSIKDATWSAVFDLWFVWKGDQIDPTSFVVMEGEIESQEVLAKFKEGDENYVRVRVKAKISKSFPIIRLPLDDHLLTIGIENSELIREKVVFIPDVENSSVSSRVAVPGYRLGKWKLIEKPHSYKTTRGDPRLPPGTKSTFSQIRMGIPLERDGWGLYLKMFQALYIALIISFLACFIKPTDVDPRFGLGLGALFAAVANSYLVSSVVPDTGELALADIINGMGILTILVTLLESTVSLYLYDQKGEIELSKRLDRVSFVVMLVGFLAANAVLAIAGGI